ncbi:MAG TPA: hypothetical protein VF069_09970 [Streptosporangiaceae bacterium]
MIFLGLAVAALAVTAGAGIVLDNTATAKLSVLDNTIPGITALWQVFVAGVVVAMVFMAGVIVTAVGASRAARVRRELRDLRDEHEESLTTLAMEKQQLQRELARARREQTPVAGSPRAAAQAPAGGQGPRQAPRQGTAGHGVASSPFFDPAS